MLNTTLTDASVTLTYYRTDADPTSALVTVPARARATVAVHEAISGVGPGQTVGIMVDSTQPIVVERSRYAPSVAGLSNVDTVDMTIGVTAPATTWHFAEGRTDAGRATTLDILNPSNEAALAQVTVYPTGGAATTIPVPVNGNRRTSVTLNGPLLDQTFSFKVESFTIEPPFTTGPSIVVERTLSFRYSPAIAGGSSQPGATTTNTIWYLSGGDTRDGVDVELIAANFGTSTASVSVTYYREGISSLISNFTVPPSGRTVVRLADAIGRNGGAGHKVGMQIQATGQSIILERATYFAAPP
jgi:hypothetical protein